MADWFSTTVAVHCQEFKCSVSIKFGKLGHSVADRSTMFGYNVNDADKLHCTWSVADGVLCSRCVVFFGCPYAVLLICNGRLFSDKQCSSALQHALYSRVTLVTNAASETAGCQFTLASPRRLIALCKAPHYLHHCQRGE